MEKIRLLAIKLIENNWFIDDINYNLIDLGWSFKFNDRKTSLGVCNGKDKTISLSIPYILLNINDLDVWDDTIRHEIAHAIDFEIRRWSDHSEIWKNIGRQVGCETEHYKDENIIRPDGKYMLCCNMCGNKKTIHKKPKAKKSCYDCCHKYNNGEYSNDYVLELVIN